MLASSDGHTTHATSNSPMTPNINNNNNNLSNGKKDSHNYTINNNVESKGNGAASVQTVVNGCTAERRIEVRGAAVGIEELILVLVYKS